ncbi:MULTISPECIES: hypothetical protein [unclassified Halorubrum]|uniref:hypothetical protein n=1 Tax=unclassified Halorubrum TaxID=2642239 RepID=UPI000B98D9EA|nr:MULTISPECIES: hypothetical protein [unclassified Halorubrum]OYR43537.1 hypothetical protein DJ81_09030 [Halorubrum sp. Hd13]OYR44905.1 hypothetical protein DJ74_16890 [Halorubrum sp. Ea8]OYR47272.1 hypothetical protein DJ75_05030 [Halorubrum sp. Eb13]OYR55061.1 hypothetical protein DJ73_02965 [Halorubrum sp. Ea1]
MTYSNKPPGPIADRTFDVGLWVGAAGGVACVALLYWANVLSVTDPLHTTVTLVLFPVYVLSVAVFLGLWLGYDTDETNLTRVMVEDESDESDRS